MITSQVDEASGILDELIRLPDMEEGHFNEFLDRFTSLFRPIRESYRSGLVDERSLSSLRQRLGELDHRFNSQNDIIHSLWMKSHCLNSSSSASSISDFEEIGFTSLFSLPFRITCKLLNIPLSCVSFFHDLFIDGDHPWKQQKYHLCLESLHEALEERGYNLEYIHCTLKEKGVLTDIEDKLVSLIEDLLDRHKEFPNPRAQYHAVIESLRQALASPFFSLEPRKSTSIQFLLDLCLVRYTEVHIYDFCRDLVTEVVFSGATADKQNAPHLLSNLSLEEQISATHQSPQSLKAPLAVLMADRLRGALNVRFDSRNNIPYTLYDLSLTLPRGEKKKIRTFRTGTPTLQRMNYSTCTYLGEAKVTEEFCGFLDAIKRDQKRLLFISLQDDSDRVIAGEKQRNYALRECQKNREDSFKFLILAQDSPFYYQNETYADLDLADNFLDVFVQQMMFQSQSGFYMPDSWKNDDMLQNKVRLILKQVLGDLYGERQTLTVEERKDFIEIVFAFLTLYFLMYTEADYLCFCCKDSVDRAMKNHAILMKVVQILSGSDSDPKSREQIEVYANAPAIIAKKRGINERCDRLLSALKLLSQNEVRERLVLQAKAFGIDEAIEIRSTRHEPVEKASSLENSPGN